MSTDATTTPLLDAPRKGYAFFEHHNSQNSHRRGRCGVVMNPKTGALDFKSCVTIRVVRHPEGGPLPHRPTLVKRNRYTPHVGAKQLAKAAR